MHSGTINGATEPFKRDSSAAAGPRSREGRLRKLGSCLHAGVLLLAVAGCAQAQSPPEYRQQLLIVAEEATSTTGWLQPMETDDDGWTPRGERIPVVFGRGGVGPKREGDGRSPEGRFPVGDAFGYGVQPPPGLKLPWQALTASSVCVDDPGSSKYNQIVEAEPGRDDFESAEQMRRDLAYGDGLYEYGVVVGYNPRGEREPETGAGKGSCIFLHVWRSDSSPTAGCTAMDKEALLDLLAWLDPAAEPVVVQGSREYLEALASRGVLPYPVPEL